MAVKAVTTSTWSSHVAWSRLQRAQRQLAVDLNAVDASPQTVASDRATIATASAEVARVEATRAAQVAALSDPRPLPAGRVLDITV
ncbi:hypothetical protein BJY16_003955 [Actinoplanes octamycinicus]|uniref:Uncharacterized protein n=1 Tax=Actinoplanes octamycinicus TaxID=135948 RepID=A0A7W7GY88_9ACTN|nr:hypothetical protein [Actinoplanes octamycinicus]MBB4740496.1 hypothetical protein [Actinoplanes octamycinicus]GIE59756.1 hypothetical protein Aoc01nite_51580 [Actinoplanes octamycinicus]